MTWEQITNYRVYHSKCNPNSNNICKLICYRWHQLGQCFFNIQECTTCQNCLKPDILPVVNTSCLQKFCYQSVYCCLIWYFFVREYTAKWLVKSSKWFQCKVMSEITYFAHVHTCRPFAQLVTATALKPG
jgi:hypothetical protein